MKRIAIQGTLGSYHDIAAHKYFEGEEIELICCATFEDVFAAVKKDSKTIGAVGPPGAHGTFGKSRYRIPSQCIKSFDSAVPIPRPGLQGAKYILYLSPTLTYFTNVSHELLTPLTVISCISDYLDQKVPAVRQQSVMLKANAEKLKRLIQQVLDFRKMDVGKLKLNVSKGDIRG